MPDYPFTPEAVTPEFERDWLLQTDDERAFALWLLRGSRALLVLFGAGLIDADEARAHDAPV